MDIKYIGICGVKGSGKSTLAQIIQNKYEKDGYKVIIIPFAYGIKKTLSNFVADSINIDLDIAKEYFYNPDKKEKIIDGIGVSARVMMTAFGTDFIRSINKNFWLKYTDHLIEKYITEYNDCEKLLFIFDDIRFANEYEYASTKGLVYFIARSFEQAHPSFIKRLFSKKVHSSEQGIYKFSTAENLLINDSDISALENVFNKLDEVYDV